MLVPQITQNDNATTGSLLMTVGPEDDSALLRCKAFSVNLPSLVLGDTTRLVVHCE